MVPSSNMLAQRQDHDPCTFALMRFHELPRYPTESWPLRPAQHEYGRRTEACARSRWGTQRYVAISNSPDRLDRS